MSGGNSGGLKLGKISRRHKIIIICLLAVVIIAVLAQTAVHPDRQAALKIVFTGGIRGHLSYEDGVSLGYDDIAGIARSAADSDDNVLLLDMGDCLGGSEVSEPENGADIIEIMNKAGYDAMVPGSLDFVYGTDALRTLRSESQFPVIAANIRDNNDKSVFEEYTVININNVRIGLTGVTSGLSQTAASREGLSINDPSDTVSMVISDMGSDVDAVIVMAYISDSDEISQIASIENVSAVITPASETSSSDTDNSGAIVVSPRMYGGSTGILSIDVSRDGSLAQCSFSEVENNKPSDGSSGVASAVEKAYSSLSEAEAKTVGTVSLREMQEPDSESEEGAETYQEENDYETDSSESETETDVTAETEEQIDNNNYETAIGDMTADAMLSEASSYGAKAALIRDRDISGSLKSGSVSKLDVDSLYNDDMYGVVCALTGGELRTILEDSFSGYPNARDFLQVSGITYTYNSATAIGSSLSDIMIDLQSIEDGASYTVVLSDDIVSDYNISSRSGAFIAAEKSIASVVCDHIASNAAQNVPQTEESSGEEEYETSGSDSSRISIQ